MPDELQEKIAQQTAELDTTPHLFMLGAIMDKLNLAYQRKNAESTAAKRFNNIVETGQTISWNDMQRYLNAKAKGLKTTRPASGKITTSKNIAK